MHCAKIREEIGKGNPGVDACAEGSMETNYSMKSHRWHRHPTHSCRTRCEFKYKYAPTAQTRLQENGKVLHRGNLDHKDGERAANQ